jgi:cellulose synthase/poly-beta-1,6-N-acetylglucosamine synthase-like glycosyltransferase
MPEVLTIIYLVYIFIAIYFLFLFLLIFVPNMNRIFYYPKPNKKYSVDIVIPCYNEEKSIRGTIESILNSDYSGLKKVIVVDDCSTDNSYEIIKELAKKYSRVLAVKMSKNFGMASGPKNYGAKFSKSELIGFADADSYPKKRALSKMMGFFNDQNVGAVTSMVLVKNRNNIIEKLQAIEYKIIAFTRKLLGFVDAIYVTPGPLAVYRRSLFDEMKGFDEKNLTEDIEITWHVVSKGYKVEMSASSRVYTVAPEKLRLWFKQRIRWNVGGMQTISKYKKEFLRSGMLGLFILPFFVLSWVLGIFGLITLIYRVSRNFLVQYLTASYSIQAQTAILTLRDINLSTNILVFFGFAILLLSLSFTAIALTYSKEKGFKKHGFINILVYMFAYLLAYPFLIVISLYKFFRGKHTW